MMYYLLYMYKNPKWDGMAMKYKSIKRGMNIVSLLLLIYDIVAINLAYFVALWLRFDCQFSQIPEKYLEPAVQIVPVYTVVMVIALASLRLYRSVWRYASIPELVRVFGASLIGAGTQLAGTLCFLERMPISYYFIGWILMFSV